MVFYFSNTQRLVHGLHLQTMVHSLMPSVISVALHSPASKTATENLPCTESTTKPPHLFPKRAQPCLGFSWLGQQIRIRWDPKYMCETSLFMKALLLVPPNKRGCEIQRQGLDRYLKILIAWLVRKSWPIKWGQNWCPQVNLMWIKRQREHCRQSRSERDWGALRKYREGHYGENLPSDGKTRDTDAARRLSQHFQSQRRHRVTPDRQQAWSKPQDCKSSLLENV